MKRKKTWIKLAFMYGLVKLVSHYIATSLGLGIYRILLDPLLNTFDQLTRDVVARIVLLLSLYPIAIVLPIIVSCFAFNQYVPAQYHADDGNPSQWAKEAMKLIFPCELVRYLLCLSQLGVISGTGRLAPIATDLYDSFWLEVTNRFDDVRRLGQISTFDGLGYVFCYLVCLIIHLLVLFIAYRRYWLIGKKEKEDLIIYNTGDVRRNF